MIYLFTAKDAQEADSYTQQKIPAIELMERAGRECFYEIAKRIKRSDNILVISGGGGNGGDGLVIARYLYENGYNVSIFISSNHLKENTQTNLLRYKGNIVKDLLTYLSANKVDVIVDAIFGVGLSTSLKKEYIDLINTLNDIQAYKISIDINSGVDATSGKILGSAFKSDLTLSIENIKTGQIIGEGSFLYKEIKPIKIGIISANPDNLIKIIEKEDLKVLFPKRERNSNKGNYGRVALIGGNKLTPGAIELSFSALAALRCGCGYANLCVPKSLYNSYALINPENIYNLFDDDDGNIKFDKEALDKIINYSSILVGPGIGANAEVFKIIEYLLKNFKGNLVIDADGLNSLAKYGIDTLLNNVCASITLTPHIKEFSRLSNIKIEDILLNPIAYAKEFSKKYHCILNLKNYVSIITDGNEVFLNTNGNPGLAKGGSGDVLSGITTSLLAKSDNLLLRVAGAAYILGRSADLALQDSNEYSLISRDVVNKISDTISEIIKS